MPSNPAGYADEIPNGIAIIGMSGRLPGARSIAEFWQNQLAGVESVSHFGPSELEDRGLHTRAPNYVAARPILQDIDLFDAEFFGILPREAAVMDPQHRLFLESCWQALEDAGYNPFAYPGAIGVIAGSSYSSYFLSQLCTQPGFIENFTSSYQIGNYPAMMGNQPEFLPTRVSYKLNLRGPSFAIQSACSTSLVAVCQACQSLLTYQSDMMLAGGVSITLPQRRGYLYQEGGMGSPDGHTRAFDADAQGTVFGSGLGVVLLKRLDDAISDGDPVYAVIRGFATNNDGLAKIGYTAPSVEGQANVIAMAQQAAAIDPETIGYVEAHGTATPLGDPIELAGLEKAFRLSTDKTNFCVIGTAKTNVGHLDIASGITGLIHAAHVVRHGRFPATLHFQQPTGSFDFAASPFKVNRVVGDWPPAHHPRRAGVSSFGVGGTNAHLILEEAPLPLAEAPARAAQLLVLSARSPEALDAATRNLVEHLQHEAGELADVAYTLQLGRRPFDYRRAVVAAGNAEAVAALEAAPALPAGARPRPSTPPAITFMFPGQGSQHWNMGRDLYKAEPVFRAEIDRCAAVLKNLLGIDLLGTLFGAEPSAGQGSEVMQTWLAQPAIFTMEYALAKLWMSWGIHPTSMVGHSVGEFVAACLSGVFSLEDALYLVGMRGRLMQDLPRGGMLSVRRSAADVLPWLDGGLSIAAINAPSLCVVSGPLAALASLEAALAGREIVCRPLHTSHAFHSAMMDPILASFAAEVGNIQLGVPAIPFVSCVTADWITPGDAQSARYWANHVRQAVDFSGAISRLQQQENPLLLEVGPGNVLSTLALQHKRPGAAHMVETSLPATPRSTEGEALLQACGRLWVAGIEPDWSHIHAGSRRRRVSLPTYPFERKRFWFQADQASTTSEQAPLPVEQTRNMPEATTTIVPIPPSKEAEAMSSTSPTRTRKLRLREMLIAIFEELSGLDISAEDDSATFLELGFDSLFLTQVTQALQTRFGLKITFRQLLGDLSTLEDLSGFLDTRLSPDQLPEPAPLPDPLPAAEVAPPSTPAVAAAPPASSDDFSQPRPAAPAGSLAQLLESQLQAFNQLCAQQLTALNGDSIAHRASHPAVTSVATPLAAPPVAPPVATSVAPQAANRLSPSLEPPPAEVKGYTPFKPMQKSVAGELTAKQREHIRHLVELYTSRTAESKRKTEEYRPYLADPRVVTGFRVQWKEMVYPIITERSEGAYLWDVDGNKYIDILNGFGPIMLGHRPSYVEEAIQHQLRKGFEIGPQTLLAGQVAKALCEMTGNERATFCNTGSEAVIAAMRVARTVSGRSKVVFFAGDYHGMFDEVLVKGFQRGGVPHSAPSSPGIPRESVSNMTVLEYGAPESLAWIRAHAHELAAVLVEPVQSRHPALQPVAFLQELRKITAEQEVCLVFDEVVTGFRVHPGGCQALFDIRADLATYGKVLAGGMPIGVLAGKAKYMDALDGGMWQYGDDSTPEAGVTFFAGTFVRHPLAMAACAAVLDHLKQEGPGLQQRLTAATAEMVASIQSLLSANQVPATIESFGSFFYFSFLSDYRFSSLFYYHLRSKGIHVLESFPCFLTTEHTPEDIRRIVQAFASTIQEMQAGELLSQPSHAPLAKTAPAAPTAVLVPDTLSPVRAPISESQLEILLSAELSSEANCSFNESVTLRLKGPLNEPALTASLAALVARHEALRATFDLESRTQAFASPVPVTIARADLSNLGPAQQQEKLAAILAEDAHRPFDLKQGPVLRATLLCFAPQHHSLVLTFHHVVCDGWSINILLDELSSTYRARVEGRSAELNVLMPFSTYALAQEQHFNGAEGARIEDYWLKQFAALPPLLDLPLDHSRPAVKSYAGATYRRSIDSSLLKDIKRAGAQQKCTLFVTLLGAFSALLARLSGQDDIVVGVPAAAQSLVEHAVLVGHCVNFLPIRSVIAGDLSAAAFLQQVRQAVFDAYDHQNYTFGRLVRKLSIPRSSGRLPLLEVQFNLEKVGSDLDFGGLQAEVDPNPKSFVNFDLFLNAIESSNGLDFHLDYNTALLDESTIARWMDCFEELLKGLTQDAARPLWQLPLLTAKEHSLVAIEPNRTARAFPATVCVHQLIEQQVARTPHAIALQFEQHQLTFSELNARANKLARYLLQAGVKPGQLVGVYIERSVEMIVALLAAWKMGNAYIPLDPTFPPERLKMVFDDVADPIILTQSALSASLPATPSRVFRVDELWAAIDLQEGGNLDRHYDPSHAAYVIYTSGSTGRPKGVQVTQSNVVNLLASMSRTPGLDATGVLVAVTTISFDIAALEIYLPLITGARLVLASRAVASDGDGLLTLLRDSKATVLQATPVTYRLLLAAGWKGDPKFESWCGGEALPRDLANQILDCKVALWNMYGPTETTIWSSVTRVVAGDGPVLVGAPIDNTQFYVLDPHRQLTPTGVVGELHIGGAGVAAGYFNAPAITREKFLDDTITHAPGARLYRTGDLVRRLPNGEFQFLGRSDGQIKLRGFRVELGEIESVLAAHPSLDQVVVMLREDVPGDKRLVGYFAGKRNDAISVNSLRSYLLARLPDYMVPAAFLKVESFPLTANGKIDRRQLPAPEWGQRTGESLYIAPRNPREHLLASIWADVLHLERVGIEDNIFDLGADSLHVFQIAARANHAGIQVKPLQILQYRSISAVFADMAASEAVPEVAPLVARSRSQYRIKPSMLEVVTETRNGKR